MNDLMDETFESFKEETHEYLKTNSLFNAKKSELYLEFQNKLLELEKKWHIQKTSFFTKYSYSKRSFDTELERIAFFKKSPLSYKNKVAEITIRLEKAKDEYRKNIQISAENYNETYSNIVDFYTSRLEKMRNEALEVYNEIKQELMGKTISLEQNLEKKLTSFKIVYNEKVSKYNQAVKIFKQEKENFKIKTQAEKDLIEKRKRMILNLKKELEKEAFEIEVNKKQFEMESELQLNELEEEKRKTVTICSKIEKEKSDLIRLILNINVSNKEEAQKLLELPSLYTFDELKKSYKKAASKYHPDLNNSGSVQNHFSKHMFQQINHSYMMLKEIFVIFS
jgi:hypothetical protein